MTEFSVQCPGCGFAFSADESHVGLNTSCANCSREFVIERSSNGDMPNPVFSNRIRPDQVVVTSGNIMAAHEIVGMVCFTTGTRGELKSTFEFQKGLVNHRIGKWQISESKEMGQLIGGLGVDQAGDLEISGQYAGASFRSSDMEIAFHIAINQLQIRASYLQADAVIGVRYDIDFDSNANVLNFIATAYGTAIRLVK